MTAEIISLPAASFQDRPDAVLSEAQRAKLKTVVVLGWDEEGSAWMASSTSDGGEVLWLSEWLKRKVFEDG